MIGIANDSAASRSTNAMASGALSIQEIEQIRTQDTNEDWSAQVCEGATLDDLDVDAIAFAPQEFKNKHPGLAGEVDRWDDIAFLNKR